MSVEFGLVKYQKSRHTFLECIAKKKVWEVYSSMAYLGLDTAVLCYVSGGLYKGNGFEFYTLEELQNIVNKILQEPFVDRNGESMYSLGHYFRTVAICEKPRQREVKQFV